jgi:hypothetical protein
MKKNSVLIASLLAVTTISAQKINIKEGSESFSTGKQNALTTTIYENTKDNVESKWKSLLKDFKNEKVKENKGEIFGDNIVIKDWGNDPVDVYTTFEEDKKSKTVTMHVAFDLGGAYMSSSSHKDKFNYAEKMVKDFAVKMTKEPLEEKVKDAEKALGKLEDNQKELEKENKNLKSDIESYKDKIKKAEDDVSKNEQNQTKKKSEIETQKKAVEEAKKLLDKVN